MKLKVQLEFPAKEADVIRNFCSEISMGVDEFCKRAVYYSINDSYKRAQSVVKEHNESQSSTITEGVDDVSYNTTSGITESDTTEGVRVESDASPSTLPHTETTPDPGTSGSPAI